MKNETALEFYERRTKKYPLEKKDWVKMLNDFAEMKVKASKKPLLNI